MLKKHFPQCFDKHGAFMPGKLQDLVSASGSELSKESYALNWLGKSYARLLANEKPRTLLSEDKEHNAKPENKVSENLLIKGDNLEVLKHLVNAYSEQVKMIYIDPPYNTGSDGFVYQDDRKFTPQQLSQLAGIDRDEAKRILSFTQSKANSHSAWLTFMYPRLYIARELLKDDGVIFISIDDNEVAQLKMLCDEVFGEESFLFQVTNLCNPKGRSQDMFVANCHEYLIAYSKKSLPKGSLNIYKTQADIIKDYKLKDEASFYYRELELRNTHREFGKHNRKNLYYPFYVKDDSSVSLSKSVDADEIYPIWEDGFEGCWTWGEAKTEQDKHLLVARKVKGSWKIYRKDYAINKNGTLASKKVKSIWTDKSFFTEKGQAAFSELFDVKGKIFQSPKSVGLIEQLLLMGSKHNSIVLDFFAGSGTTAHAVMQLNAEDSGNRHCISVQIDEATNIKSEAYKAGYTSIFDITKARLEKAAVKIKEEKSDYEGNLGFKLFETKALPETYLNDIPTLSSDHPVLPFPSNNIDDMLTTWKVYDGIALTKYLLEVDLADYTAYQYDKVCYLMHKGFSSDALVAFLQKLDDTDNLFEVEKLVVNGVNFDSKYQREIAEAISQYKNKKDKHISVEFRY
ncbi:MAG: DNA methyltransferase [Mariprofundaceae bacterium]|nr:DNA methyltransferase [Mariprofundaceae bacterium]